MVLLYLVIFTGCNGGNPTTAFDSIVNTGGQDVYSAYPYSGELSDIVLTLHLYVSTYINHVTHHRY